MRHALGHLSCAMSTLAMPIVKLGRTKITLEQATQIARERLQNEPLMLW